MELKICHLYSDLLSSNGDNGNVLCLSRRCSWRGIIVQASLDKGIKPVFFCEVADVRVVVVGDEELRLA